MNLALYIGIIFVMYITPTVAYQVGILHVGFASYMLVVILAFIHIARYNIGKLLVKFKREAIIVLIALFILLIKLMTGDFNGIKNVLFFLIIPAILSILLQNQDDLLKQNIARLVLFFFVTECLLAIYERGFILNLFPYFNENAEFIMDHLPEELGFRSTAFLGHPLLNALCVSIIMGFVLTSTMKSFNKMILITMGYIALMSFNARASMLIWAILIIIHILNIALRKKSNALRTSSMFIFFLFIIYGLFKLIVNKNYGDRLFLNANIMDESAKIRLDIFDSFSYMNITDFLLGNSSYTYNLLNTFNIGGTENSYILIISSYGLIMSLFLFVAYYFWIKRLLIHYNLYSKMIIITSFILVGSTNNGLSGQTPWVFFIICATSFLSLNQPKIRYNENRNLNHLP